MFILIRYSLSIWHNSKIVQRLGQQQTVWYFLKRQLKKKACRYQEKHSQFCYQTLHKMGV
jgi:hypothetical protein